MTKELESFVSRKVKSGRYGSASEVVRESLRLLEQEDLRKRLSISTGAELEAKLLEGVELLDCGEHMPARDVENVLIRRSAVRRKKQHA